MTTLDVVKKQAKILQDFLKNKSTDDAITYTSCLQAIAKINEYKDWNTMKPILPHINQNKMASTDDEYVLRSEFDELKQYVHSLAGEHDALSVKVIHHPQAGGLMVVNSPKGCHYQVHL